MNKLLEISDLCNIQTRSQTLNKSGHVQNCFFDMCNFSPFSFFINSPQMLHSTGFGCLLNAFFAANLYDTYIYLILIPEREHKFKIDIKNKQIMFDKV
ncbi:hypothetical protein BpHYR1_006873 [Brachionus plicatilis]|uniref:Uncharacterized protein n=1 Tax=Brachionus plicatilis TaxID=10195 RepID=A0A3M7T1L1_BRAPC|nr:hypothetical protein BpHYR1_006873 [Brachionus plicatilis]